ncbi:MAG TPA: GGDEF domain-containing protein [Acidimicrobiia bacterium]|nr:GGDEF domain-containing protein [Acidimicrobiia bacterium]
MDRDQEIEALRRQLAERDNELRRLSAVVDSFLSVDVDSGLLNRNGILDAIRRASLWWDRRREPFGVMVIRMPRLADLDHASSLPVIARISSALADAGRAVDDIGRLDPATFALVLREFHRHGATAVVSRMRIALRQTIANPDLTDDIRFGLIVAVESGDYEPEDYLDHALTASLEATPDLHRFAE